MRSWERGRVRRGPPAAEGPAPRPAKRWPRVRTRDWRPDVRGLADAARDELGNRRPSYPSHALVLCPPTPMRIDRPSITGPEGAQSVRRRGRVDGMVVVAASCSNSAALDPDHVVAVTTLASQEDRSGRRRWWARSGASATLLGAEADPAPRRPPAAAVVTGVRVLGLAPHASLEAQWAAQGPRRDDPRPLPGAPAGRGAAGPRRSASAPGRAAAVPGGPRPRPGRQRGSGSPGPDRGPHAPRGPRLPRDLRARLHRGHAPPERALERAPRLRGGALRRAPPRRAGGGGTASSRTAGASGRPPAAVRRAATTRAARGV